MKKLILLAFCVLGIAASTAAETLNNQSIIGMVQAGLGEGLIIDKINSLPCGYDVATDQLIALKRVGVAESIVGAMVRRCATLSQQRGISGDDSAGDPMVRHSPGIYLAQSWLTPQKLQSLRPSKPSAIKTSGNGSILFPLMEKMVILGSSSPVSVRSAQPTFYFYFNVSDEKVSDFGSANSIAAQSPDEFNLARLRSTKDGRELVIGKVSAYGGIAMSIKKGIDPKATIQFSTDQIASGIFKITFDHTLEPGEYAFVFSGSNASARVYDFSVTS